jgi:type IX secretion system PorP/SprF family membrane protein
MRVSLLIALISFFWLNTSAQQQAVFGLQSLNLPGMNPAAAGLDRQFHAGMQYRQQWLGFSKAPATGKFNFSAPIARAAGIGVTYQNDRLGVSMLNDVRVSFSYRIALKKEKDIFLYFGLDAGVVQIKNDAASVKTVLPDVSFTEAVVNRWMPQAGAGLLVKGKRFYVSASAPRLLSPTMNGKLEMFNTGTDRSRMYQDVLLGGAYDFDLKGKATLGPAAMLHYTPFHGPLSFELSLRATVIERIRMGAGYRHEDAYLFYLGGELVKGLWVNYAYEFPVNASQGLQSGTHEAGITYSFQLRKSVAKSSTVSASLPGR